MRASEKGRKETDKGGGRARGGEGRKGGRKGRRRRRREYERERNCRELFACSVPLSIQMSMYRKIIKLYNVILSINSTFIVPNSQDVIIPIRRAITRYLTPLSNCRTDTHTGKVEIVYRQSGREEVAERDGGGERSETGIARATCRHKRERERKIGKERQNRSKTKSHGKERGGQGRRRRWYSQVR